MRIEKTVTAPFQTFSGGQEIYVVDGSLEDEFGVHRSGSWLRYPPDGGHCLTSQSGCMLYIQTGGRAFAEQVKDT